MVGRDRDRVTSWDVKMARGGVTWGGVLTGVVVAFGAMFLLSAIVGGILVATGVDASDITKDNTVEIGIGAAVVVILAQLLSYLWGGYTAGRMGRGAGALNGLLVPIVAIIVAIIVGAIAKALGADEANLAIPFSTNRLPVENDFLVDYGAGIGIGALAAMLVGGVVGGMLGQRWHTKLERRTLEDATTTRTTDEETAKD